MSQFYSLIAQADDLLQQAKASSSISAQDYAKYYQNVASTIQKGIQEINSLNITDDDVNQVRRQIVQSLQQMETDYLALSHAFSIIASASTWTTVKPA